MNEAEAKELLADLFAAQRKLRTMVGAGAHKTFERATDDYFRLYGRVIEALCRQMSPGDRENGQ